LYFNHNLNLELFYFIQNLDLKYRGVGLSNFPILF
jgi:hypothetical protein